MAMDKEKLLSYFQAHYLSRQEVLFKLPLNISIDSFWPELLNRRKARAQLLPLYNASGMPYWYVLTDRMIAASERLCEEAIGQDTAFDPYRAGMTSAMTEEMFFTSFVEGAQIPLQEAMDFLQRGTEPESIQEQMIWNNRRAWAEMTATIYRPLDGSFVRGLAFMLTEEMDDCAEDYRQTDQHPIAAMNNESYEVPPAYSLPDRMNEYYDFLQKPDIHPLIKAAVAQAYLLVIRPFPEGNERLSRMMSSAVLLRSGYDFFRDISISSVIARESYRYYKCMCDIIRSENGGDLTYFLQYYLELLVRALDVRNERQRKREQEAREREQETLRQERELARKPLTPTVQPCEEDNIDWDVPDDADGTPLPKPPAPVDDEPADAEDVDTADPDSPFVSSYSRVQQPLPLMEPNRFLQAISKLKHSRYPGIRDMPDKVSQMIRAGLLQFSVSQWSEITGTDKKNADYECRYMYEKGWMTRTKEDKCLIYSLRIRTDGVDFENGLISLPGLSENPEGMAGENEAGQLVEEDSSPHESLQTRLIQLEQSRSPLVQSIVTTIHDLQDQGINAFTCNEWMGYSGLSAIKARDACDYMLQHRLVINISLTKKRALYAFIGSQEAQDYLTSSPEPTPVVDSEPIPAALISRLHEMASPEASDKEQRISAILLSLYEKGVYSFAAEEFEREFRLSRNVCANTLRSAINLGLLSREPGRSNKGHYRYSFNRKPVQDVRSDELTPGQRTVLTTLYVAFKNHHFSVQEGAKVCHLQDSGFIFHANNFMERGILTAEKKMGRVYAFAFATNPQKNPECFTHEDTVISHHTSSSLSATPIPMAAASA